MIDINEHWGGSAAIGTPTRGGLLGAAELPPMSEIDHIGKYPYATERTITSIVRAIRNVHRCHPATGPLFVGDLSRKHGGYLKPHRSHQNGLDADLGFYYRNGRGTWYERATRANLDVPRTWSLVRGLLEGGNIEVIFVDQTVMDLLEAHRKSLPDRDALGDEVFRSPAKRAKLQHAWGHRTHMHVRWLDPEAEALGKELDLWFADAKRRKRFSADDD